MDGSPSSRCRATAPASPADVDTPHDLDAAPWRPSEDRRQFRVDVPIDEAWKVLLDIERIAPCMPGAQLQEIEGDEYRGIVKVKVGPDHRAVQGRGADRRGRRGRPPDRARQAEGRDTRGQGNASATVIVTLDAPTATAPRSRSTPTSTITGKVAQFGRGVMADVSGKLLGQFVAPRGRRAERRRLSRRVRRRDRRRRSGDAEPPAAGRAATAPVAASAGECRTTACA